MTQPFYIDQHSFSDHNPTHGWVLDPTRPAFSPCGVRYIYTDHVDLTPDEVAHIKAQMNAFLLMDAAATDRFFAKFSEVRRITPADCAHEQCDEALVGQWGVFATVDVPALFVLGTYSGIYIEQPSHLTLLLQRYDIDAIVPYMFTLNAKGEFPRISAFAHGNRISLVNAATNYGGGWDEGQRLRALRQNTQGIYAKTVNNPNEVILGDPDRVDAIFYMTRRPVPAGTQFLTDYGAPYWGCPEG
jgi:hypothetical protein